MSTSSRGSAGAAVTAETGAIDVGEGVSGSLGCGVSVICDEAAAVAVSVAAAVSGVLLALSVIHTKKGVKKKGKKERKDTHPNLRPITLCRIRNWKCERLNLFLFFVSIFCFLFP